MKLSKYYERIQRKDEGYHIFELNKNPRFISASCNIRIDNYSLFLFMDTNPILIGNVIISTPIGDIKSNRDDINMRLAITTKNAYLNPEELIMIKDDGDLLNVLDYFNESSSAFLSMIFLGEDMTTGEEIFGMVFSSNAFPYGIILTTSEHYQYILLSLYVKMVDLAFRSNKDEIDKSPHARHEIIDKEENNYELQW